MLPPLGNEPRASDLTALHASELLPLFAESLRPLDPYIVMLCWFLVSYPELGPHLVNPDLTPSKHNPDHAQGPKWTPVTVDRPTHWAPSARAHHSRNTCYLILELTQTRADYCMTHSCNHTTRSTTNKDHLITSQHTVVNVITVT